MRRRADRAAEAGFHQEIHTPKVSTMAAANAIRRTSAMITGPRLKKIARISRIDGAEIRGKSELGDVGDDDFEAEGKEQSVEHRRANDPVQQQSLDQIAEHEHGHGRNGQRKGSIPSPVNRYQAR